MTPREPDRFEEKAREVWASCLHEGDSPSHEPIAAALRAEHDEALERAAQIAYEERAKAWKSSRAADARGDHYVGAANSVSASAAQRIAVTIRALASPAAAPAAEVKVNACQVDLRTDKDRECFDDIVQAATRVLRSEPVTPAPLLPRVLAALEKWADYDGGEMHDLAAELRAYIAEREPAEKRIAELERDYRAYAEWAATEFGWRAWQADESYEEWQARLARAAKAKGDGR